jgi:3-methyladenine DNA glycosylase AlkC
MEQIAMDMGNLMAWQFPECSGRAQELRDIGLVSRMRLGGEILLETFGVEVTAQAAAWSSDTARGWGAMAVGAAEGLDLEQRLALIRPFADDPHFAVREWAWLSLRPRVGAEVKRSVAELVPWTAEDSPRLRRFASEVTRPRGVWSAHIALLKAEPSLGLPLLEPLKTDPSRYVQDSVANWLNDASKSQPQWVEETCDSWMADRPDTTTARICRRACRSLGISAKSRGRGSSTLVI